MISKSIIFATLFIGVSGVYAHMMTCANMAFEAAPAGKPSFGYQPARRAEPSVGTPVDVGKCVNLGGMLERTVEGDLGRPFRDKDLSILKSAGFKTVRLPIKVDAHTQSAPPYRIDPKFLARVSHVVDVASKRDLQIIVDVHHYKQVMADPEGQRARFVAIWKQLAEHFQKAPPSVWFELLNEPGDKFWADEDVWIIFAPALAEIRKTNPVRTIVISGGRGSQLQSLDSLTLPDDPNLVPTFHFYEPKAFSHQGANWTTRRYPVGRRFTQGDATAIHGYLAQVQLYMKRSGRVPLLGEYGAYDIAGITPSDRVNYYGVVSSAFASIGVQSCAWSFTNGFSIYRDGAWLPGFPDAIVTTAP